MPLVAQDTIQVLAAASSEGSTEGGSNSSSFALFLQGLGSSQAVGLRDIVPLWLLAGDLAQFLPNKPLYMAVHNIASSFPLGKSAHKKEQQGASTMAVADFVYPPLGNDIPSLLSYSSH